MLFLLDYISVQAREVESWTGGEGGAGVLFVQLVLFFIRNKVFVFFD